MPMPALPAVSKKPNAQRLAQFVTPHAIKKIVLLGVLSVQIGFQPLLMGWFAKDATNVSLRVGVIEAMKLAMALLPLIVQRQFMSELRQWSFHNALQTTAAPALIYVLQNYLNQSAVVVLDGVTFNILNQTKIIWTAVLVYFMLQRYQSRQQIAALTMLCAAAVLMTTSSSSSQSSSDTVSSHETVTDAAFFTGAYQALIAAILSALAGTIIQRALQTQKRNAYVVTIELSVLGELTIVLWSLTAGSGLLTKPNDAGIDTHTSPTEGLWDGWTALTCFALLCQAVGGVVVGFVIKHCGNVEKSFAVVFGMIITALLESQYNNKPFGERGVVAIAMVGVSTLLYTMYPPAGATAADADADANAPVVTPKKIDATVAMTHHIGSVVVGSTGRKMVGSTADKRVVAIELEPFLPRAVGPVSTNSKTAADAHAAGALLPR